VRPDCAAPSSSSAGSRARRSWSCASNGGAPTTETIRLAESEPLDLDATLGCGQAFRWERRSGWWNGVVGERALGLRLVGRTLQVRGADEAFVRDYLALDHDLDSILSSIGQDDALRAAVDLSYGLRIVRQPVFECLISFLCATNTNISAVRHRVGALADRFGRRLDRAGVPGAHAFPTAAELGAATTDDLRACRLGYRAEFAGRTIAEVCGSPDWEEALRVQPYEEARATLMALDGIGPKAADCIALYGLGHLEAFPVDVWVRRILARHYLRGLDDGPLSPRGYEGVWAFGRARFGTYAGYAQVYLFGARDLLCRP
jgi:N-glycosylase/DNA lyase